MAPVTGQELRDQIAEALRTARWDGHLPDDAHGQHQYHGACAICRGDVTAIADAVMPLVQARLDEQTASFDQRLSNVQEEIRRTAETQDRIRERLTTERDQAKRLLHNRVQDVVDLSQRAEQAEAERDRLDDQLRGVRTLRLMWAKVGEHGMPDTREIFAQCARDLGSILDKEQP